MCNRIRRNGCCRLFHQAGVHSHQQYYPESELIFLFCITHLSTQFIIVVNLCEYSHIDRINYCILNAEIIIHISLRRVIKKDQEQNNQLIDSMIHKIYILWIQFH